MAIVTNLHILKIKFLFCLIFLIVFVFFFFLFGYNYKEICNEIIKFIVTMLQIFFHIFYKMKSFTQKRGNLHFMANRSFR